ncbi:MAG: general secretion pathway protein GspB [Desulfuromonas sp.]
MSYILEALKKSEKKRQGEQGSLAHLATQEPAGHEPPPKRRPLWPLLLGIALVINAGVLLFIFWPSAPQLPPDVQTSTLHQGVKAELTTGRVAPEAASFTSPVSPQRAETQEVRPLQAEAAPEASLAAKPEPAPAPAKEVAQLPAGPGAVSQQQKQPPTGTERQAAQTAQAESQETSEPLTTSTPAMEQSTAPAAHLNELALSFRSQLPEMHMSVHVYTGSPHTGLVRINENMLRPGDYLDNRLLLEEITPDGAVFSYLGQRFLLPRRH